MAEAGPSIPVKYAQETIEGIAKLNQNMKRYVDEVCEKVLKPLREHYQKKVQSKKLKDDLDSCLKDICLSLKVHLYFHCGQGERGEDKLLEELQKDLGLNPERLPKQESVIDPGSKLLEMFSIYALAERPDAARGSKHHAERVFYLANNWLKDLDEDNKFKPKVLAKVSYNERCFIGASVAVSHYLRPICLHQRIIRFKKTLGKKIIHFDSRKIIQNPDNWRFEAYRSKKKQGYIAKRPLCTNCEAMFRGERLEKGHRTFLGACAEYCAVNELLPVEETLLDNADAEDNSLIQRNYTRCTLLFENFRIISDKCNETDKDDDEALKSLYWEIIYILHIFGLKPECNPSF